MDKPGLFLTTRWSVVLAAQDDSRAALETLCRSYWPPLYGYARRRGHSPHDAEDFTQAFFARLLEKDYLKAVRPERGPFRAFLQMAFRRFLSKERDRAAAAQRGGGAAHLPWELSGAEGAYAEEPAHLPAEEAFELRWALTVFGAAVKMLRDEFAAAGRQVEFEALKPALSAPPDGLCYTEMAAALGVSEGAARVAAHRLRKRFRETLFRREVAQTVARDEEIEEEVRHLISVLTRG